MASNRFADCINVMNGEHPKNISYKKDVLDDLKNKIEHGKAFVKKNWSEFCRLSRAYEDLFREFDTYCLFFPNSRYEKKADYSENIKSDYILQRTGHLQLYNYILDKFIKVFLKYRPDLAQSKQSKIILWCRNLRLKYHRLANTIKYSFI